MNDDAIREVTIFAATAMSMRTVWRRCWLSHATAVATPRMTMLKQTQIMFMTMVPRWLPSYMRARMLSGQIMPAPGNWK